MTSDFFDNAATTHTAHCGAGQNLRKTQNGFRRRYSIQSVDADVPSPITNGKCTNGKFLPPLSTSMDEAMFKGDRAFGNGTLPAVIEPAAHSSTSTGVQCGRESGGLLDQLRSTQLVYWTMTLSFIINYFWNRRHNLRAFFAAWAMLAAAAFFAALFFATVVFSYFFYDLPRKMSSSLPMAAVSSSASSASASPSYCSLGEENSPLSSRRSSAILPSPPLSASDDNDSNNSDCSTFYSCSRTPASTAGDRKSPAAAHFWQGNVSTGVIYYDFLVSKQPCRAKVAFDMTLGVATAAPKFKPSSEYGYDRNYWSSNNDKYLNSEENDDDDDEDDDDSDSRARKKIKRLVREMILEEKIKKKLKAKKSALKAKQNTYRMPEPKSSPIFGGDGSSSNYHGITVQEKISRLPVLDLPFVQDAMNDLSLKSGMPNMLDPFLWKPKHCMVSATCGPRERCINGKCTGADQSRPMFQPRPQLRPPSFQTAARRHVLNMRPHQLSNSQPQLSEKSPTVTTNDKERAPVVERCWFFCDMYSNYDSKLSRMM